MQSSYQPSVKLSQIKNLVFEGGSVKGIAYVGAVEELQKKMAEQGLSFQNIERIGGTSAGAITATLLSIGCTTSESKKKLNKINFSNFLDEKFTNVRQALFEIKKRYKQHQYPLLAIELIWDPNISGGLTKISKSKGLFYGEEIRNWIEKQIYKKTGIHYLTFRELHELKIKNPDKYKDW